MLKRLKSHFQHLASKAFHLIEAEKRIFMHFSERHAHFKCPFGGAGSEFRLILRGAKFSLSFKFC